MVLHLRESTKENETKAEKPEEAVAVSSDAPTS